MIRQETIDINSITYTRTYSDTGMMIHGGDPEADYEEAYDPAELNRTYVETDIPIDGTEAEAEELLSILTGESE